MTMSSVENEFESPYVCNMQTACQNALANSDGCFVSFGGVTFAIIRDVSSGKYFVFDSHATNEMGLFDENGKSVLIKFNTVTGVYSHESVIVFCLQNH